MRKMIAGLASVAVVGVLTAGSSVIAAETGVAQALHAMVRIGGRTCLVDHYHDGNGTGPTQASAARAAIGAWSGFTAWEYGSSWGRYGLAVGKSMKCARSSGGWSCDVSARPCRGW